MPYIDPITELIQQRRDELQRLDTELAVREAEVHQRREGIADDLRKLDIAVEVYASFASDRQRVTDIVTHDAAVEVKPATNGTTPTLDGTTIAESAAAYLRSVGGTGRAKPMLEALEAAGRIKASPHSISTLSKTLANSPRFEKLSRGLWRLREGEPIERP